MNEHRRGQISTGQRSAKGWTWNTQRGEVVDHTSGHRYRLSEFLRGNLDE
jgi:protein subunit release factor A